MKQQIKKMAEKEQKAYAEFAFNTDRPSQMDTIKKKEEIIKKISNKEETSKKGKKKKSKNKQIEVPNEKILTKAETNEVEKKEPSKKENPFKAKSTSKEVSNENATKGKKRHSAEGKKSNNNNQIEIESEIEIESISEISTNTLTAIEHLISQNKNLSKQELVEIYQRNSTLLEDLISYNNKFGSINDLDTLVEELERKREDFEQREEENPDLAFFSNPVDELIAEEENEGVPYEMYANSESEECN